ncbi:unnamed protein product [Clonostachys byssicola]|uniref:N-acetyltransferase domain-containing protein n=1 Tax=Clonostachys byssicola TaxID=160290 RepID=A0A9N9XU16_9HYPO|nr:unnamed protein product [Clonostachys byssicola]
MPGPTFFKFDGPSGEIIAVFGQVAADQWLPAFKLGASGFRGPLPSVEDYLEREEYLASLQFTKDCRMKTWCVYNIDDPSQVFAMCKAMPRDLLIGDEHGFRREAGYCLTSVVTDEQYRNKGLGRFLLEQVSEWVDSQGQGAVTFLYTSSPSFFANKGWHAQSTPQAAILPFPSTSFYEKAGLPPTRILRGADIPELCNRDVDRFIKAVEQQTVPNDTTLVTVVPAADMIVWMHARCEFISYKLRNEAPDFNGAIHEETGTWLYWAHDFSGDQLAVQRISRPQEGDVPVEVIASLLLDARNEAATWGLSRVSIWSPPHDVGAAGQLLSSKTSDRFVYEKQRTDAVPMVRLGLGDASKEIYFGYNEYYAWN